MFTILHAEDDPVIVQVLPNVLKLIDAVIVLVQRDNGAKAHAYLDAGNHVDLLVTDWNMPEMDGLELVKRLRSDERFSDLPILFTSARSAQELVVATTAGANAIVRKPFDYATLAAAIRSLLHIP